jgi:hypothetical protein
VLKRQPVKQTIKYISRLYPYTGKSRQFSVTWLEDPAAAGGTLMPVYTPTKEEKMPRTVTALYEDLNEARTVVADLVAAGYEREEISLVASTREGGKDVVIEEGKPATGDGPRDVAARGVAAGGALGGLTGLILGASAITVPGIGALLVAGPILAIYGALAGSIGGGLLGLLVQSGVREEEAPYYEEGLRRGMAMVALEVQEQDAARAEKIMKSHNPADLEARTAEWRQEGWTGYTAEVSNETRPEAPEKSHRYATGALDSDAYGPDEMDRGPSLPDYDEED